MLNVHSAQMLAVVINCCSFIISVDLCRFLAFLLNFISKESRCFLMDFSKFACEIQSQISNFLRWKFKKNKNKR